VPDSSGGEVDRGEEISGGFVVARGDGAERFEFAEEVLGQVARLVEVVVEITARATMFAGGITAAFPALASGRMTR
jgi:hypothetical protein